MTSLGGMFSSWLGVVGYQAAGFLATALTAIVAVGVVPPHVFGDYWILLSIVQIVSGFCLSWVAQSLLPFARAEINAGGSGLVSLSTAVALQAAILGPILLVGWLARPLLSHVVDITPAVFTALALAVLLNAIFETTSYGLQARERFQGLGRGAALSKLGPLAAVLAIGAGVTASPLVLLLGFAGGIGAGFLAIVGALPARHPHPSAPTLARAREIGAYGWRLPLAIGVGLAAAWMHVWFVRVYVGADAAGTYSWAASIHALVGAVLMPLSAVIAPHMMDLVFTEQHEASRQRVRIFLAATALTVIAAPTGLALVRLLAGALPERYADAGPILVLLLTAVPAQLISYLASPLLRASSSMIGRVVAMNVLMAVLSVPLNLVLTPWLGGIGAALSLSLSTWAGALLITALSDDMIGAARDATRRKLAQLALGGAISLATGLLAIRLGAGAALACGVLLSFALLLTARWLGLLSPLAKLRLHLGFLPHAPRLVLTRFLDWCDVGAENRRCHGAG